MGMTILVVVVGIVMNVFSGNFGATVNAVFQAENRKTPLGAVAVGNETDVTILVDESFTNNWQSNMNSQTSDILVYAQAGSVLANKTCQGGIIKIGSRSLRIETYAVARNQRTGDVAHIEERIHLR